MYETTGGELVMLK